MAAVAKSIAQNLGVPGAHKLAPRSDQFSLDDVPDLAGKVAVITGASEGIGFGVLHGLLSKNVSKVVSLSLSQEVVDSAVKALQEDGELPKDAADRVEWKLMNLSDWGGVARTAGEISDKNERIDILVCCAARGIMSYQMDEKHGVDQHMSTNYFGHAILIDKLLPKLIETSEQQTDGARVVLLSSNLIAAAPKETTFATEDDLRSDVGPQPLYGRSKLADLLLARHLASAVTSKHAKLLANATHPGIVKTRQTTKWIGDAYPGAEIPFNMLNPIKKDIFQGSLSTLYAATKTQRSGDFVCPPATVEEGTEQSNSTEVRANLLRLTRAVLQKQAGIELSI